MNSSNKYCLNEDNDPVILQFKIKIDLKNCFMNLVDFPMIGEMCFYLPIELATRAFRRIYLEFTS